MEQLIVVFTGRRNIGQTAIPYLATINHAQPITLHEHATLLHVKNDGNRFTEPEKEIIELLHRISDQYLFKKYTREGTVKSFIDKINLDPRFDKLIKPYIESVMYKTVRYLARHGVPCYYKSGTFSNLYHSDQLQVFPCPAIPGCYFDLQEEQLLYSLKIRQSTGNDQQLEEFQLKNRQIEFLSNEPAIFKLGNQIYYFDNIDSKKFKPFLEKTVISIPSRQVPVYMEGFVANCVRYYQVEAKGFTVDVTCESPGVLLKILVDLNQQPVIALHFSYKQRTFLADRKAAIFVDLEKNNGHYRFHKITRDFKFEEGIVTKLNELGLAKVSDALFLPAAIKDEPPGKNRLPGIVSWLNRNLANLQEIQVSVSPGYGSTRLFLGKYSIDINTGNDNDWFEIHANIQIGEFTIPFIRFRKLLVAGQHEFILPDGEVFIIPDEWFTRFSELINYAKFDGVIIRLPKSHFRVMEQVKHGTLKASSNDREIIFPDTEVPRGLMAKLRPYQHEGYAWLNFLSQNKFGGILADDMGLGKTLQTIALLLKLYQDASNIQCNDEDFTGNPNQVSICDQPRVELPVSNGLPASLVCMPTTLLHNWMDELKKFAPGIKTYVYAGNNRLKSKEIGKIFNQYHVVITSYGVLRNDAELLKTYRFHYFVLDESQHIKNPASKIYDAVKSIVTNHYLVLTGTPIENSLVDLWAQMNLVNRGLLGSLPFFKRHFIIPVTRNKDAGKELKLQKLIQPFLLRRTKEKVAQDLPPVMEQVLYCDMTPEQELFYEKEKSGIRNSIYKVFESKSPEQTAIIALQALTRLRQIANHPVMVDASYSGSSGKFEQVLENLESVVAEKHNVLVFSSFVKDLELIETEIIKRGILYAKLTGATTKREQVIKSFSGEGECRVFLISLKAGGVGLNLTKADYIFMLNPWWNPAAESQAISRAHRIGQTRNVFVYRFLSTGSIEEKIARLQEKKANLANAFIGSSNPLKDLSRQEIIEMFS